MAADLDDRRRLCPAQVLRELAVRYADCWTYSVDGLIGSTPEMLVKVDGDTARARVLAGTLDRDGAPSGADGADHAHRHLVEDLKQRHEHRRPARAAVPADIDFVLSRTSSAPPVSY